MENKKEWIAGREGTLDLGITDPHVGRRHARLTKEADGLYIEDLDSKAGTYVNGKAVKRKKIGLQDRVLLGPDCVLDVGKVLELLPLSDAEFAEAFHRLKAVYETHGKAKLEIQSRGQGKMMLKRMLPMAIPGLLIAVSGAGGGGPFILIAGAVLSAVAMTGGAIWGAREMERIPGRIFELEEQFKMDYVCPDCKRFLGSTPWEGLRRQGECPCCKRKLNV